MIPLLVSFAFAALGFIAQFTPAEDPTGILGLVGPALFGVLNAFIVARVTKKEARARVKLGLSAALALAAAVVTALRMDWSDWMAAPLLFERALLILGAAQATFMTVDKVLEAKSGAGLNEQPVFKPEAGIG